MITRRAFVESAACGLTGGVAGLFGAGCAAMPPSNFSLLAFKYGESTLPESMVFRPSLPLHFSKRVI